MNETQEPKETYPRRNQFEDEVELIDYLRTMWKWKWLIIGGTLLCIVAAAIYGFTRPVVRMYKVSALIEIDPELIEIDPEAKLDPLDKIKSMIEYGIFNQRILNDLSNLQGISKPESLSFQVAIPKGLNILDIGYKTPDADLGKAVLNSLAKRIEENYAEAIEKANENIAYNIELMKKEFELDLAGIRGKIKEYAAAIETLREKISIIRDRIDQTKEMLKQAELNSAKLADKRVATTLDSQDEIGHANVFLQASAIQQIINYPIELRERIDSLIFKEKAFLSEILFSNNVIKGLEQNIEISKLKIELMKHDRDQFTEIIIRQPPTASLLPIKYKAKRNAILAGAVGFFFSIFLAFFIEYLKSASKRTQKAG